MLKNIVLAAVFTGGSYYLLKPFGWTFDQTINVSILISFVCSLLSGIIYELVKLNKKKE